MFELHEALQYVVRREGSDLHLKVPSRAAAIRRWAFPPPRAHPQLVTSRHERCRRRMAMGSPNFSS